MTTWQLRDPAFRQAIRSVVDGAAGRCALAGTVAAQIHVAAAIGIDKLGPPAHAIQLVLFGGATLPQQAGAVPVEIVDALGFEPSVQARRSIVELSGQPYPTAAPEHVLGLALAAPDLTPDVRWACFVLMHVCGDGLDLEEVRGVLKRSSSPDRQSLLAELAYLAA
jgi:hypothetical protein